MQKDIKKYNSIANALKLSHFALGHQYDHSQIIMTRLN